MSIGRSFEEIIQKGLRMIGQGMHGFVGNEGVEFDDLDYELSHPTDLRVFAIAEALEKGYAIDRIFELTNIIRWKTSPPTCCAKPKCLASPTSRLPASC